MTTPPIFLTPQFHPFQKREPAAEHYQTFRERYTAAGEGSGRIYLFPAPSIAQGKLLEAFMRTAGVRFQALPLEDEECLALGRSFTNRGQCAPVVYITGNLIKYLLKLRTQGCSDEAILRDYGFIMVKTSGGACRLPTYEEEYRKALKAIGLEDFVIELIDIGLSKQADSGLRINRKFYIRIFLAIMLGDILNDIARRIRPYEVTPGETDRVVSEATAMIGGAYSDDSEKELVSSLRRARRKIEAIAVNLAQIKPKVMIVGEFYVASTEGHCTGDMFRWLESQGAEVRVRSVTIYLLHKIWRRIWLSDREFWTLHNQGLSAWTKHILKSVKRRLLYFGLVRKHARYSKLLGSYAYPLPRMGKMLLQTKGLYHRAFFSGEGFMEIAEHIDAAREGSADMVLSLKPFTCLPSVCSDAIQSKIELDEPNSIFLALEMSGDATTNCRSRVQMKLEEARMKLERQLGDLASHWATTPDGAVARIQGLALGVNALQCRRSVTGTTFFDLAARLG